MDILLFVLGTITAFLTALVFFYLEKDRKSISFLIKKGKSLVNVEDSISDELVMYFQGERVYKMILYSVILINTGNRAIEKDDWDRELTVALPCGVNLISVKGMLTKSQLEIPIAVNNGEIKLDKILLNPNDRVDLEIILDSEADFDVSSRVVNGTEAKNFLLSSRTDLAMGSRNDWIVKSVIVILAFLAMFLFTELTMRIIYPEIGGFNSLIGAPRRLVVTYFLTQMFYFFLYFFLFAYPVFIFAPKHASSAARFDYYRMKRLGIQTSINLEEWKKSL